ncbi:hypothetical protein D3C81_1294060 [compost metagenome]
MRFQVAADVFAQQALAVIQAVDVERGISHGGLRPCMRGFSLQGAFVFLPLVVRKWRQFSWAGRAKATGFSRGKISASVSHLTAQVSSAAISRRMSNPPRGGGMLRLRGYRGSTRLQIPPESEHEDTSHRVAGHPLSDRRRRHAMGRARSAGGCRIQRGCAGHDHGADPADARCPATRDRPHA